MKVLEITPSSWLVKDEQGAGLISKRNRGGYLVIKNRHAVEVDNRQALNEFFQWDVFGNISTQEINSESDHTVMGFPVNYPTPVVFESECDPLPVFAKRADTHVRFCAGYYAIHSQMGWRPVFCPKLSTLERYEYRGPFRQEDDAKKAIRELRGTVNST